MFDVMPDNIEQDLTAEREKRLTEIFFFHF